jgi:hypothetical protein
MVGWQTHREKIDGKWQLKAASWNALPDVK